MSLVVPLVTALLAGLCILHLSQLRLYLRETRLVTLQLVVLKTRQQRGNTEPTERNWLPTVYTIQQRSVQIELEKSQTGLKRSKLSHLPG